MLKFRNQFTADSNAFISNPGTKIVADYGLVTAEDGSTSVGVIGEKNIDAIIQSNKDTGNVALLVAKYNAGDEEALNRVRGVYGDFRNMPTTYAEMVSRLNECRSVLKLCLLILKNSLIITLMFFGLNMELKDLIILLLAILNSLLITNLIISCLAIQMSSPL